MQFSSLSFSGLPVVVKNLLLINAVMFVTMLSGVGDVFGRTMSEWLGLHYFASPLFEPWQLVTHIFMHAGPDNGKDFYMHIVFNMLLLFMLGPPLEHKWGSKRFLTYYLVTGIGAGILYNATFTFEYFRLLDALPSDAVAEIAANGRAVRSEGMRYTNPAWHDLNMFFSHRGVGASGALYGILLAFGLTFPNVELVFFPIFVPIKARYMVWILGAVTVYMIYRNNPDDNVGHLAHLGGMLVGYLLIKYWRDRGDMGEWKRWDRGNAGR